MSFDSSQVKSLPIKHALVRAVKSRFPRIKFALWSWRNPGKTFSEFYAECAAAALEGKKKHASLGPSLKAGRHEKAAGTFKQLVAQGIAPTDTVVDYGCGTLRVGRSFIELLEPDRYIGMDIDHCILDVGRRNLPPELIAYKRPTLEVISGESLIRVAARKPKWIFAGVLQHVPPTELNEFLQTWLISYTPAPSLFCLHVAPRRALHFHPRPGCMSSSNCRPLLLVMAWNSSNGSDHEY
jgi:hypothetical protein